MRVFVNRALRIIFGTKRDKVTLRWRKLHNEELHNTVTVDGIIKMLLCTTYNLMLQYKVHNFYFQ
jgi:hypothetical protein